MRVVQQLEDARAALQAGALDLLTLPNSGCIAGIGYWHAVHVALAKEFDCFRLFVDCGENAAVAHDALRVGLNVRFVGSDSMAAKLQAIATAQGLKILDKSAA